MLALWGCELVAASPRYQQRIETPKQYPRKQQWPGWQYYIIYLSQSSRTIPRPKKVACNTHPWVYITVFLLRERFTMSNALQNTPIFLPFGDELVNLVHSQVLFDSPSSNPSFLIRRDSNISSSFSFIFENLEGVGMLNVEFDLCVRKHDTLQWKQFYNLHTFFHSPWGWVYVLLLRTMRRLKKR